MSTGAMKMDKRWELAPTSPEFRVFVKEQENRFREHLSKVARDRILAQFRVTDIGAGHAPRQEIVFLTRDGMLAAESEVEDPEGLTPTQIIAEVAKKHQVSRGEITGSRRTREIVAARHEAIHRVARAYPEWSYPEIARAFGMDRTSIMSALGVRKNKGKA